LIGITIVLALAYSLGDSHHLVSWSFDAIRDGGRFAGHVARRTAATLQRTL
jgi:hypothetical protein